MLAPAFLQLEPVGQCNLRCQMCPIQFRKDGPPYGPPAFMSMETFRALIDGFPSAAELHLQGLGEPLLHPHFFEMVAYAVKHGRRVSTNTNGTLLTAANARRCLTSGLERLFVSMDGATAETYERIRAGSNHALVWKHIRSFMDVKRSAGADTPHLRIVMVVMRQNLEELPGLVRQAHEVGAEGLSAQHLCHDFGESSLPEHFKPMRAFVDEQTLLNEDPEHVRAVFAKAEALASKLGLWLKLPNLQPIAHPPGTPGPQRCDWPWRGPYVSFDGRAMPCCMVSTPDRINFGSMRDRPAEVWEGPEYREFRERLASDDPPDVCRSCSVYRGTF
jgi:MoaA/NifB/PqqE/SkfB family radical SAM enzyme